MWQWVVIYLVLAIIVYGLIYYVFFRHSGYSAPMQQATPTSSQSQAAPSSNIYLMKTDATKGTYLTDFQGRTLYTYDKDTTGVSNCTGGCASAWPPYTSGAVAQGTFPAHISVITRSDGSKQFGWDGMPLYYFATDTQPGQITGDGVNGFHIVK